MKLTKKTGSDFGSILAIALLAALLALVPITFSSCASRAGSIGAESEGGPPQGMPLDLSAVKAELESAPMPVGADETVWDALGKAFIIELERAQSNRTANAVPGQDAGRVDDFKFDSATGLISWTYKNLGDYDLSGEVGIADITAIALNFGKTIEYDGEGKPTGDIETPEGLENHRLAWIDGDKNGEIGISDVTTVAINYSNDVAEYAIVSAFYAQAPASEWTEIARVSMPDGAEFPLKFELELPGGARNIIAVRAADRDGNMGTMSNFAVISETEAPVIYGIDIPSAITGKFAQFKAALSGDLPLMYEWNFGGGALPAFSYGESPTVLFGQPGLYTGTLTVSNYAGADMIEFEYTVFEEPYNPPVPIAQAWPITGDAPLEVHFICVNSYSPNGAIEKYEWDFDGDGTYDYESATPANATYTYEGGVWRARLRVTDEAGRTADAQTDEIIVFPNEKWELKEIVYPTGFTIKGAFEDPFTRRPGFAYGKSSPSRVGYAILNDAENWRITEFQTSAPGEALYAGMSPDGTAWFYRPSTGFIEECRRDETIQTIIANAAPGPGTKILKSATVGPDNTVYALVLATGIAAGNKVFAGRYEFPGFDWVEVPIPNKAATSIIVDPEGRIACASSGNNVWFSFKDSGGWINELVEMVPLNIAYTDVTILPTLAGFGIIAEYYPGIGANKVIYSEQQVHYWTSQQLISPRDDDSTYARRLMGFASPDGKLQGFAIFLDKPRLFRIYLHEEDEWFKETVYVPFVSSLSGSAVFMDGKKDMHFFLSCDTEEGIRRYFYLARRYN